MKKALALLLSLMMTISLCACAQKTACTCNCVCGQTAADSSTPPAGGNESASEPQAIVDTENSTPPADEKASAEEQPVAADAENSVPSTGASELTAEQQLIVDAVTAQIHSDTFAAWQSLAKDFMGSDSRAPEVTAVYHYSIDDFDDEKIDCYLVNISADVGYWSNEEAQEGALLDRYQIFISADGKTVMDSISTDAGNFNNDISTSEDRAIYLLWMFGSMMDGSYKGDFVNDRETVTIWTDADLSVVNENI